MLDCLVFNLFLMNRILPLPEELNLSHVPTFEIKKIKGLYDKNPELLVGVTGLSGAGKSTFSRNVSNKLLAKNIDLQDFTINDRKSHLLELDWLISVPRGPEKVSFLKNASVNQMQESFFRKDNFRHLILSVLTGKKYSMSNAYNQDDNGKLNGKLKVDRKNPNSKIILAEGVVANALVQDTKDLIESVGILINTNPVLSILNTVKRGVEDPKRRKEPTAAFKEFLSMNKLLIPVIFSKEIQKYDYICGSEELDNQIYNSLVGFFSKNRNMLLELKKVALIERKNYPKFDCLKTKDKDKVLISIFSEYLIELMNGLESDVLNYVD